MADNNEQNRKEAERIMRQKMVEAKMENLINSSVNLNIKLVEGKKWDFIPEKKIITYSNVGDTSIFNLTSDEVVAYVLHEIAHANYTESFSPKSWPEPAADYGTFLNCIEDIRVEKQLMNRYPGTYDSFKKIADNIQGQLEEDCIRLVPNQINYLLNLRQHQWKFKLFFKNKQVEDLFLDTLFLVKKASNLKSLSETHHFLANDLWPRYKELLEEMDTEPGDGGHSSIKPPPGQADESPSGDPQDADNSGGSSDSEQGSKSENAGAKGQGGSAEQTEEQKQEEKYRNEVKATLSKAFKDNMPEMKEIVDMVRSVSRNADKNKGKTLGDEIDEEIQKQKERLATEEQDSAQPDPEVNVSGKKSYSDFRSYEQLYADIQIYLPYFKMKLKSIMKDNDIKRFGGAFTRGKLNNKLLYKWKCKSSKIFSQKLHRAHKNYAVTLLVDESGSMTGGDKHINAARAAVLLSEVLDAVHIPFEIRGFNEGQRLYKAFARPFTWAVKRNLENIIPSAHGHGSGNTNDAYAINWANHSLIQQDAERILIVLCDGEPNPSDSVIPMADYNRLKRKFRRYTDFSLDTEVAKAKKSTLVVGVGIQSNCVVEHYQHNVICETVAELPKLVLGILKKNIRRG